MNVRKSFKTCKNIVGFRLLGNKVYSGLFGSELIDTIGFPKNGAPFALLLWRSHRLNYVSFSLFHRSGFNLEFETLFESI